MTSGEIVGGHFARIFFYSVLSFIRLDNGVTKISKMTCTILETDNNTKNIANVSLFHSDFRLYSKLPCKAHTNPYNFCNSRVVSLGYLYLIIPHAMTLNRNVQKLSFLLYCVEFYSPN